MKKELIAISLLMIILSSCAVNRPLLRSQAENNETYKVDYLFEHDGCKVYRFMDDGKYVYFTNCNGNTSVAQSDTTSYYNIQNTIKVKAEE